MQPKPRAATSAMSRRGSEDGMVSENGFDYVNFEHCTKMDCAFGQKNKFLHINSCSFYIFLVPMAWGIVTHHISIRIPDKFRATKSETKARLTDFYAYQ